MKRYIVYDSDGSILRAGNCQESTLPLQAAPGEFVMEGQADDRTQKISGTRIVDKAPAELAAENTVAEYTEAPAAGDMPIMIAQGQWDAVLQRLADLEAKLL